MNKPFKRFIKKNCEANKMIFLTSIIDTLTLQIGTIFAAFHALDI